ncbi:hypothetical protein A8L50_02480 [Pantoea ananatis]|nr:hypothetical protein [Pantoea ananatis]NQE81283.1 hypothetical protein [Pantoea ananatis]
MFAVYRVQSSSDAYFHYQLSRHQLVNATMVVSEGATGNYSIYINQNVKVYFIKSTNVNLSALESDFRLNPPTKDTFKQLGGSEFFI